MIHMKNQALFSSKDKSKKKKKSSAAILFGALRVKFDAKEKALIEAFLSPAFMSQQILLSLKYGSLQTDINVKLLIAFCIAMQDLFFIWLQ